MIDVIDYRAGNAPSVVYALEHLGLPCRLVSTSDEITRSERIILPGVGAARATLESLADQGLVDALDQPRARRGRAVPRHLHRPAGALRPQRGRRHPLPGLGIRDGAALPDDRRVPQIGWNEVRFARDHPLTASLPELGHYYFVNSYYCSPADDADVLGVTDYGVEFCSVVARANIVATQFHAEKSGRLGLALLREFATWDPAC